MSRIAIAVALLLGALCVAAKDPKVTNKVGCGLRGCGAGAVGRDRREGAGRGRQMPRPCD